MVEDGRQTDGDEEHDFKAAVASATFVQVGITIIDSNMALSLFINQPGGSNLLVGLVPAISCSSAPQSGVPPILA